MSRLSASWSIALEALLRHPLRTALSMLGIIIGTAALTAVLALGDGAEAFARRSIEQEGWNEVAVSPITSREVDGLAVPVDDYPRFDAGTVDALSAALGETASVHVSVEGTHRFEASDGRERAVHVIGRVDTPDMPEPARAVAEGRVFTPAEAHSGAPVAVVGFRFAQVLRETTGGGRVGDSLTVGPMTFTIIGVLPEREGERILLLMVPFAHATTMLGSGSQAPAARLAVIAGSVEQVDHVKNTVQAFVEQQPEWAGRVSVSALGRERLEQVARGILTFKLLMGAFTAISLLVGGIGIMNVLLASILERTREIGVRKAVGARRQDILGQFLVEAVVVTLAGSIMGVLLGIGGAYGVTAIIRAQSQALMYAGWSWSTALAATTVALVIGLAAGLYPAWRAAQLAPLDAIQRE